MSKQPEFFVITAVDHKDNDYLISTDDGQISSWNSFKAAKHWCLSFTKHASQNAYKFRISRLHNKNPIYKSLELTKGVKLFKLIWRKSILCYGVRLNSKGWQELRQGAKDP